MNRSLEAGFAGPADEAGRRAGVGAAGGRRWAQAALIAAVFGLGLYQGYRWAPAEASPVAYEGGSLVATGALENALYDPAPGTREAGPAVGAAFANQAGESCRRFAEGRVEGVACQRDGDWRVVEMRQH